MIFPRVKVRVTGICALISNTQHDVHHHQISDVKIKYSPVTSKNILCGMAWSMDLKLLFVQRKKDSLSGCDTLLSSGNGDSTEQTGSIFRCHRITLTLTYRPCFENL